MAPAQMSVKHPRYEKPTVERSRIFQPFRALGYITNDVPVIIESRGQDYFLTTSVGRNFQTYNIAKMNLLFVGPQCDRPITAMAAAQGATYTACGNMVLGFKRGREVSRVGGEGNFSIHQILVLGSLVAALCDDNILRIWDITTRELYTEIEFDESFTATTMVHPNTYLNKLLVASSQGTMQLWNIRTHTMIYQFKPFSSAVTCLTQSPVVDVIAVGLLDGSVLLHNIKADEQIDSVRQADRVTAISFRTDEEQMMATGNMHGDVTLWDLKTRHVAHIMKGCHDGYVTSVSFLHGQPILVTAGSDNAVKQWIFEKHNNTPKLFKSRSGHYAQPTKIRYYDEEGRIILSAGRDRALRAFSVVRDSQSVELSQGRVQSKANARNMLAEEFKLPPIVDFAAERTKEKEWDNVITCHTHDSAAYTWTMKNKRIGKHKLSNDDGSEVKTVSISACGNFGFLGYKSGNIYVYNMQSGIMRKHFSKDIGHCKPITGIASDNVNKYLVSSSVDKTIKIWDYRSAKVLHTIELDAQVESMCFRRENDLLAVICDDLGIRVIDIETKKIVREFWGHTNRITDLDFSPDGRWLVSAGLDATVRTWDLPTGTMVDLFKVENVVTSLTFSPTGDFLATAHVDNVGIFLWSNRGLFANLSLHSIPIDEEAKLLSLPSLNYDNDDTSDDDDTSDMSVTLEDTSNVDQLADDVITLSLEPRSKWHNLLHLDTIKKRNKPAEAPKAPEQAPFFLPTLPGAKPRFDTTQMKSDQDDTSNGDQRFTFGSLNIESEFSRLLRIGNEHGNDYTAFVDYAKSLGASAIDVEIRSLTVDSELSYFGYFVDAILFMLKSRKNFEFAQAWLSAFATIHGDIIKENSGHALHDKLKHLLQAQEKECGRLSGELHYAKCLLDFARRA